MPSSINDKSVRYMPKYGMHGGSHRCKASRITRNLPSAQTTACSLLMVCFIYCKEKRLSSYKMRIIWRGNSNIYLRYTTHMLILHCYGRQVSVNVSKEKSTFDVICDRCKSLFIQDDIYKHYYWSANKLGRKSIYCLYETDKNRKSRENYEQLRFFI